MTCTVCRSEKSDFFRVTRQQNGQETLRADVCSVSCAVRWFYKYAQANGMMLAAKAKNTFDQFVEGLRNLRGGTG